MKARYSFCVGGRRRRARMTFFSYVPGECVASKDASATSTPSTVNTMLINRAAVQSWATDPAVTFLLVCLFVHVNILVAATLTG